MECQEWVNEYAKWFSSNVTYKETDGGCLVDTPFLSIDNDHLMLRIQQNKDDIVIGDCAYALEYLYLHDYNLDKVDFVNQVVNKLGLKLIDDEIVASATQDDFGRKMINVMHAVNNVCSLVYTTRARDKKYFRDEVEEYFGAAGLAPGKNVSIQGQSTKHFFDFSIHNRDDLYLIDPLSTNSVTNARRIAQAMAFKSIDIRYTNLKFKSMAILDDTRDDVWDNADVKKILSDYVDSVFKWTKEREQIRRILDVS